VTSSFRLWVPQCIGPGGEERTEKALARLGSDYTVFHDRRIPGSRANIDHIVVGPTGVFVIETKNVKGKVELRRGELFVAGRRKQAFVEEAWREAAAVQSVVPEVLASLGFDVRPLLCFHRADLPWGKTLADGVPIVYPKGILKVLCDGASRLNAVQVQGVTRQIESRLPPA
jgi:hypothetical protein